VDVPAPFVPDVDAEAAFEADLLAVAFGLDGLVLPDVPAAGDDFGLVALPAFCVGPGEAVPPQLVPDAEGVGLADVVAFGLTVDFSVAVSVGETVVSVAFGEPVPEALADPVDGLAGGLLLAPAGALEVVVAGGLVLRAGLLVFGEVRGDDAGDEDTGGQEGAAAAA